jgi:hypothetical protein
MYRSSINKKPITNLKELKQIRSYLDKNLIEYYQYYINNGFYIVILEKTY